MREISRVERNTHKPGQIKRVAAYARVSTDSEKLIHSLSAQIKYYSDYIQKNSDWVYAGVYADEGISGTNMSKRTEFKRLLKDCENGKIDIILVKSISRFARNTVDLLKIIRQLKELGVEVRFEKENINSLSNDGELMLSILASFAQEESRSISENVKWGARRRFEKGIPNGKAKVFGYRWETDLVIENDEAEVVKRIYREFLNGNSPRKIAKILNEDGVVTERGCNWSDSGIRYVLTNITYTGDMILQKTFVDDLLSKKRKTNSGELPRYLVKNTHEPIISKEVFESVQREIRRRSANGKSVFTSKIRCAKCGEFYIRNTVGKGDANKVWVCKTKKKYGKIVCDAKNIKEEMLKEILAEALGLSEFDGNIFLGNIDVIEICAEYMLRFIMKDKNIVIREWKWENGGSGKDSNYNTCDG